jgi:hypothetical protein
MLVEAEAADDSDTASGAARIGSIRSLAVVCSMVAYATVPIIGALPPKASAVGPADIWPEPGANVMNVPFDAATPEKFEVKAGSAGFAAKSMKAAPVCRTVSSPFPKKENASPGIFFMNPLK